MFIVAFLILFFITGLAVGTFLFLRPSAALELQRRFYLKINWRIEPVDMQKELRNTRIMGVFLTAISLLGAAVVFFIVLFP
ncbi:MAG: hypothetical protein ACOY3D_04695 [Candidatus Omnitrophota bacterium]